MHCVTYECKQFKVNDPNAGSHVLFYLFLRSYSCVKERVCTIMQQYHGAKICRKKSSSCCQGNSDFFFLFCFILFFCLLRCYAIYWWGRGNRWFQNYIKCALIFRAKQVDPSVFSPGHSFILSPLLFASKAYVSVSFLPAFITLPHHLFRISLSFLF